MLDEDEDRRRQRRLTLLQRVFMMFLLLICIASDYFLFQHEYLLDYKILRHLVDSAAHGSVAFCCWGIFLLQIEKYSESGGSTLSSLGVLKKCFFNGVTASLLDIDHFLAAGALSLAGATHLQGRPFGHAVTFIIVVALLVSRCSRRCQARKRRYRVCFLVIAWFSHQLRDGMRRGLWFWPLGSTPPINYFLYLAMEEGLPFVMAKWWRRAPAMTEMEKLELALQKADEESEQESDEEANSSDEEGATLLASANAKRNPSSTMKSSPRSNQSDLIV
ncbi:Transmembrane protein 267 [Phytophthora ramorum]|uniref:Transmembrane protein 267 n=1 Tax=Phytophthora ramorum TaxID=164328 RepID=UPI0030B0BF7B|nr:Transmembrane protein 267 [Phytophthora ramorum]